MGGLGNQRVTALIIVCLGGLGLTSCTAGTPAASPAASQAASPAVTGPLAAAPGGLEDSADAPPGTGTDVGNGRPGTTYDGLMVRRRVVVAVHHAEDADAETLRQRLADTATERGLELADISPDVLGAATLEHMVPEVIMALPTESTTADAEALAAAAFGPEGSFAGLKHVHVGSVLVHDLRFTVASPDPGTAAADIEYEGIVSDALGNYVMDVDAAALSIHYTGPILSDALVESVRAGMGRSVGTGADAIEVGPRSQEGTGVILANEPPQPAVTDEAGQSHDDGHSEGGGDDSGH